MEDGKLPAGTRGGAGAPIGPDVVEAPTGPTGFGDSFGDAKAPAGLTLAKSLLQLGLTTD